MPICFPGSRASRCIVVALKDKCINDKFLLPSSLFLLVYVAKQMPCGMEYLLVSLGQLLWLHSPNILPILTGEWRNVGKPAVML